MKKLVLLASSFLFLNSCGNIEDSEITSEVFNGVQYEGLKTHKLNDYMTLVHDDRPDTGPGTTHGKGFNFSMDRLDLFSQLNQNSLSDIASPYYSLTGCKFFTQGQNVPADYQNSKVSSPLQFSWAIVCINQFLLGGASFNVAFSDGTGHNELHKSCKSFYSLAKSKYEEEYEIINPNKLKFVSINKNIIACRTK